MSFRVVFPYAIHLNELLYHCSQNSQILLEYREHIDLLITLNNCVMIKK